MAFTFNQKLVSSKIDILSDQRNHLQTLVQEIDEVLQQANSWLMNADETNSVNFKEINKSIDEMFVFLSDRFTNCSVGCKKISDQQKSPTTRSSLPARYGQELVVPDELKTIMSQVKVMQDAMSFLSTNTEKISEKQLIMEQCIENLSIKYFKEEQQKLKEIERELKNISEKQKKTTAQQDKRIKSFENRIQAVTDAQSEINENQQLQKTMMKEQKKDNGQHLKQSEEFTKDLNAVQENIQELNVRICLLENQGLINTDLEDLENKLTFLKENYESLTEKFEEQVSLSEEFSRKVEETLTNLSPVEGKEFEKLQKFEEKISALEMSWSETSRETEKSYKDVENKYQMVCQVIADRLAPLERLKVIFNQKLDVRKENMKKLDNVCDQMADLLPKLSQLETENQRQTIVYSAHVSCHKNTSTDVKEFTDTINVGKHFNPATGVFTAPVKGFYATYLAITSTEISNITFSIIKEPCKCCHSFHWCNECNVVRIQMSKDKHACSSTVVDMNAGETLFMRRGLVTGPEKYNITLTCYRIL